MYVCTDQAVSGRYCRVDATMRQALFRVSAFKIEELVLQHDKSFDDVSGSSALCTSQYAKKSFINDDLTPRFILVSYSVAASNAYTPCFRFWSADQQC